ncbi:hypothetical protein ACHAXA_002985 [Cyclostephanos tholiformis]|uniref:BAP29/BAP31 transmembrane domain-containing protein n=1 Tax=Cyclostephanos tholiformis TaxID=382380 RepID=A0ABD3SBY2_9STRA
MGLSLMTWGHMIWIFFPIPLFCLVLLSLIPPRRFGNSYLAPRHRKVERLATEFVGRIFFTPVSLGKFSIRLVYFFIFASLVIFVVAFRTIHAGFDSAHIPCSGTACHYHSGETMWYRKASRYRAERNFWLSLFTLVLWLLVYDIYSLKRQIVILRASSSASATADVMTTGEFHRRNDKAE